MSFSKLPGTVTNISNQSVYSWSNRDNVKLVDTNHAHVQTHIQSGGPPAP